MKAILKENKEKAMKTTRISKKWKIEIGKIEKRRFN